MGLLWFGDEIHIHGLFELETIESGIVMNLYNLYNMQIQAFEFESEEVESRSSTHEQIIYMIKKLFKNNTQLIDDSQTIITPNSV